MEYLIWAGAVVSLLGVAGILASVLTISRARRAGLDDAGLRRVLAKVQEWQDRAQPSYNLGKRNCVHFVMEIAETVGLAVNRKSKYFKKPRSFLEEVKSLNPALK